MTKPHRATPEQWESIEVQYADFSDFYSCFLELRARIEALEAAQQPHQDKMDRLITIDRDDLANSPVERIATKIGPEWQPCVKLPITVHVREQRPSETHSSTREGITPLRPDDLIMRGVQGEEYPIGRELFNQTYRMGAALAQPEPVAPTDEEIGEWHDQCADLTRLGEVDHYWAFDLRSDEVAGVVRTALARWGTPANALEQLDD